MPFCDGPCNCLALSQRASPQRYVRLCRHDLPMSNTYFLQSSRPDSHKIRTQSGLFKESPPLFWWKNKSFSRPGRCENISREGGCERRSGAQQHVELEYFFSLSNKVPFYTFKEMGFLWVGLCEGKYSPNSNRRTEYWFWSDMPNVEGCPGCTVNTVNTSGNAKASPSRIKETRGWKQGGHRKKELEEASWDQLELFTIQNWKLVWCLCVGDSC